MTDSKGKSKKILIVDTPGFFDTDVSITNDIVEKKIASQIFEMTSPGVHAFLIVLRVGRFTPEEMNTVNFIRTIFGNDAAGYCIVVFTCEDQLDGQTIDDFISSSSQLQQLVSSCGHRKFVINNKMTGQALQRKIQQLLQMIQGMITKNKETCYTNKTYREIEKKREQERKKQEEEVIFDNSSRKIYLNVSSYFRLNDRNKPKLMLQLNATTKS